MSELLLPGMTNLKAKCKTYGQWRLRRMQLVNWGGFEGHHDIEFDAVGTLLSGASGTGKSTILDAHIAVLMESSVAFNGASNDSGTGRARSAEQRNVLSYMRGQTDLAHDDDAGMQQKLLRGSDRATWSAIAETYQHDDATEYTALRVYHAPATLTNSSQVFTQFIQSPGTLMLTELETFAADRFDRRKLRAAYPSFTFFDSYTHFATSLHMRLGIGRDGDGAPAMRMLARIQAGKTITSVETLYKDMVLEQPPTYQSADKTIDHYGSLEASHSQMVTAEAQIAALTAVPELAERLAVAQTELVLLDTFKLADQGAAGPVTLWSARLRKELLESEGRTAHSRAEGAFKDQQQALEEITDLEGQLAANLQSQRDNGGDALEALGAEIVLAAGRIRNARAANAELARRAPMLDAPTSEATFAAMQQSGRSVLDTFETNRAELASRSEGLIRQQYPVSEKARELKDELAYLAGRRNLIPRDLDAARSQIAEHVGLDPHELPFVAELIDLDAAHEQWRQAGELLLGGFGRTMLIDRNHSSFRRRLDSLRLGNRINFQLVPARMDRTELDPTYLPGRLVFDTESPFIGWLTGELDRSYCYECLLTPDFPDDGQRRITLAGQVQNGARGSHGGHGRAHILGFSTAARAEELQQSLKATNLELDELVRLKNAVTQSLRQLEALKEASSHVLDLRWADLDVVTAQQQHDNSVQRRDELVASSDQLPQLQKQASQLKERLEQRRKDEVRAGDLHSEQQELWGQLVDTEDATSRLVDRLEDDGITVTDSQAERLMAEYEQYANTMASDELDTVLARMRQELMRKSSRARDDVRTSSNQLTQTFTGFLARWPDPDLGTGPESAADFITILEKLEANGLAARRAEFTKRVIDWSSEDLLGLAGDYDEAIGEIRNRLTPVNAVLAELPYGPGGDQLQIKMQQLRDNDVTKFVQDLRRLASSTTRITEDEVDQRFAELGEFIDRIRYVPGSGRDQLLDVRRHIRIEAQRIDRNTGAVLSSYDSLGSKSGGETQELIAFILGAALRYRLGTSEGGLPAYATVVLDEAFIKADSEFAGRAVSAWQGLGFQLIIGAPLDKVPALSPYVNQFVSVTKHGGYSKVRVTSDVNPMRAKLLAGVSTGVAAGPGLRVVGDLDTLAGTTQREAP